MRSNKGNRKYRVFVSHGWADTWVAKQIARRIEQDCGADTFLDVFDVEKGVDFEEEIFREIPKCKELVVLLTARSSERSWVWVEIGAARICKLRIVPVLYGLTLRDLDEAGGKAFLGAKNITDINELDDYLNQLKNRVRRTK